MCILLILLVVSSEENIYSVSGTTESSLDLTFVQQADVLQSMVDGVVDTFLN